MNLCNFTKTRAISCIMFYIQEFSQLTIKSIELHLTSILQFSGIMITIEEVEDENLIPNTMIILTMEKVLKEIITLR